jgi:molybdopterin molybdotransferase
MLLGITDPSPVPRINARLSINLNSQSGREDYIPVKVVESSEGTIAEPVFGRSNLIFTLIRADGLITIAPEVTGLPAGSDVIVELFPW